VTQAAQLTPSTSKTVSAMAAAGAGAAWEAGAAACASSWMPAHPAQQNTSVAPFLPVRLTGVGAGSPQWAHFAMAVVAMSVTRKV